MRENEQLIAKSKSGTITISNRGENKDILLSRLLRYDDKCEVLNPIEYREEMKNILSNALSNYGEL